jgi:iron complex transport system ATP-binding protein
MLGRYPYLRNVWWETDEDETLVEETLKKFGVDHLKDRPLNMLSSGERQRVLIAKAYVQEPRLMLVDEPTSHLDMKYKLEVMEYLQYMVRKDMSILVAEHDISLMARYCDLCIIMKSGELVAFGEPKKIITPELIEDVYGVSASVGFDDDGEMFVLPKRYRPRV